VALCHHSLLTFCQQLILGCDWLPNRAAPYQTAVTRFSGVLPPLPVLLVQLTILPDNLVVTISVTSRMALDLQTAWLLQWISQSHRLGQIF
jgi:hypothetical protein